MIDPPSYLSMESLSFCNELVVLGDFATLCDYLLNEQEFVQEFGWELINPVCLALGDLVSPPGSERCLQIVLAHANAKEVCLALEGVISVASAPLLFKVLSFIPGSLIVLLAQSANCVIGLVNAVLLAMKRISWVSSKEEVTVASFLNASCFFRTMTSMLSLPSTSLSCDSTQCAHVKQRLALCVLCFLYSAAGSQVDIHEKVKTEIVSALFSFFKIGGVSFHDFESEYSICLLVLFHYLLVHQWQPENMPCIWSPGYIFRCTIASLKPMLSTQDIQYIKCALDTILIASKMCSSLPRFIDPNESFMGGLSTLSHLMVWHGDEMIRKLARESFNACMSLLEDKQVADVCQHFLEFGASDSFQSYLVQCLKNIMAKSLTECNNRFATHVVSLLTSVAEKITSDNILQFSETAIASINVFRFVYVRIAQFQKDAEIWQKHAYIQAVLHQLRQSLLACRDECTRMLEIGLHADSPDSASFNLSSNHFLFCVPKENHVSTIKEVLCKIDLLLSLIERVFEIANEFL